MFDFIEGFTVWGVIPLMVFTGLFFTCGLRAIQIRGLAEGVGHLLDTKDATKGSITNFEAASAVLAGNLGTGNISGMAVALSVGGPGSLFWMWIMVFLGMAIKYAECLLGVKFRHVNAEGEYVGGPMYYLARMRYKILPMLFCLFTIGAALTAGNLVQVNSLVLPLQTSPFVDFGLGIVVAVAVALILIGGLQRIAHVVATVVPVMTFLYLFAAILILALFAHKLPHALSLIFSEAWNLPSAGGAVAGWGMIQAMKAGFERGIFATDAGTGMSGILQSSAQTKDAASEGLVGMVPPLVVLFVCTITTLVLLVTGAWQEPGLQSTNMCTWAFRCGLGHVAAPWLVIVSIVLFGVTTILAWAFCAEKAVEYLFGLKAIRWFNVFFIAFIPLGAIAEVKSVWMLADLFIALMVVTNLIGVLFNWKTVLKETPH